MSQNINTLWITPIFQEQAIAIISKWWSCTSENQALSTGYKRLAITFILCLCAFYRNLAGCFNKPSTRPWLDLLIQFLCPLLCSQFCQVAFVCDTTADPKKQETCFASKCEHVSWHCHMTYIGTNEHQGTQAIHWDTWFWQLVNSSPDMPFSLCLTLNIYSESGCKHRRQSNYV